MEVDISDFKQGILITVGSPDCVHYIKIVSVGNGKLSVNSFKPSVFDDSIRVERIEEN